MKASCSGLARVHHLVKSFLLFLTDPPAIRTVLCGDRDHDLGFHKSSTQCLAHQDQDVSGLRCLVNVHLHACTMYWVAEELGSEPQAGRKPSCWGAVGVADNRTKSAIILEGTV